jgi:antirestriction protein ArdC
MTNDKAKKMADEALSRLMEALEAGRSEVLKTYLAVMARFHRYSWGNALLIASQHPEATRVAGFHAWRKLGRYVRKGEKGIIILAPMVGRKRRAEDEELAEDEQTRVFGFRAAYVFDVSQTEGEPLPEFATVKGDPQEYTERLKQFVADQEIALEYDRAQLPGEPWKGRKR